MQEFKLDGMDRLRTTTEQAMILGILKDKNIDGETSRPNHTIIYFALGAISVLAVVAILYKIHRDKNRKEE